MQSSGGSGFAALPQQDQSLPLVYDADAQNHTQRSLSVQPIDQQTRQTVDTRPVATALSPINEHDGETQHERLYDPVNPNNGGSYSEYYGPEDLARAAAVQQGGSTAYHGADYDEWDASYKESESLPQSSARRPPNYKPYVFQAWFLGLVLFIVCAFLALSELAVHTLPDGTKEATPQSTQGGGGELRPRQDAFGVVLAPRGSIATDGGAFIEVRATDADVVELEQTTTSHQSASDFLQMTQSASVAELTLVSTSGSSTSVSAFGESTSATSTSVTTSSTSSLSTTLSSSTGSSTTESTSSVTSTSTSKSESGTTTGPSYTTSSLKSTSSTSQTLSSRSSSSASIGTMSTTSMSGLPFGSNSTSSHSGLRTCTETIFGSDDESETGPATTTVPVVTVTVGGNSTTRTHRSSTRTTKSMPPMTASCDVTVTISIPFYPSTAPSPSSDPGTEPPTYITVGQNTVTVTLDDGTGTTNLNDPVAPPEPTSTCYYRTVTVTEESNLAIATVTVTYDVVVNAGQPSRRAKTAPVAAADVPYYQRRACVEGGVFTVTQKIAQPMVITQTIWRTITQQDQVSIVVEPPTTSTYVVTTEGSTFSTTETRPAVTTTSSQSLPTGAGTTITETKTNAHGSTVVNAFTGVIVSHDDSVVTSVTLVPVTTTNALGQSITMVQPSMVTQTLPKVDNGVIIITTDENGHIVVTTKEADFSILSQDASLESTLIMAATTLTDPRGHTTLTTSVPVWATPFTTTRTDSAGSATTTETLLVLHEPHTTTFTGTDGEATSTATYYLVTSSATLKGPNGTPTATSVTTQTMTLSLTTETNAAGIPTKTGTVLAIAAFPVGAVKTDSSPDPTGSPAPNTELQVFSITAAEYATGLIIPTLLATLLTLPLRILDHVAKLYHPFHVLATTPSGASAGHSVCWETTGLWTFITRFQHFMSGELLLAATGTLVALGTILVPLSAETVRLILHGPECRPGTGTAKNCGITLGVFPLWSRVVVGILCVMAALLVFLVIWLWRVHRTGLNGKPWSLTAMAGLSENQDFQAVLSRLKHVEEQEGSVSNDDAKKLLSGFSYALESRQEGAMLKYSIVPVEDARHGPVPDVDNLGTQTSISSDGASNSRSRKPMPFVVLTLWGRVVILLVLLGMLTLIVTYWALGAKTPLGRWMRSETVGVRILVVTVGMIITLFWSSYFYCKSLFPPSDRQQNMHSNEPNSFFRRRLHNPIPHPQHLPVPRSRRCQHGHLDKPSERPRALPRLPQRHS